MTTPKETWDSLTAHVARGERAEEILNLVWSDCGPYGGKPSEQLMKELREFFKFDDSELKCNITPLTLHHALQRTAIVKLTS